MTVYSTCGKQVISYTTLVCSECGHEMGVDGLQHGILILRRDVSATCCPVLCLHIPVVCLLIPVLHAVYVRF